MGRGCPPEVSREAENARNWFFRRELCGARDPGEELIIIPSSTPTEVAFRSRRL